MSENKKQTGKNEMKALREQRKAAVNRARNAIKSQNKDIKSIREAMAGGGKTIPEIASAAGMSSSRALVYVATLKKYGLIAEGAKDGDYFKYELIDAK